MPIREPVLVDGYYYHVFNRGFQKNPVFFDVKSYSRFVDIINFYRFKYNFLSYSRFLKMTLACRDITFSEMEKKNENLIDILSYVLMPNHYHFLLKQKIENGISKFIKNITDSYTRFFNIKSSRSGNLFHGQFKAVLIETDEQLMHVSRYIHLNPYTSGLVKNLTELKDYCWSSLPEYLNFKTGFCKKEEILNYFNSVESYWKFVCDQADYQRKLSNLKYLIIE